MLQHYNHLSVCRLQPCWPVRSVEGSCCWRTWKHISFWTTLTATCPASVPCLVSPLMNSVSTSTLHIQTKVQSVHPQAACFHLTMKQLKPCLTPAAAPLVKQRRPQTRRVQLGKLHPWPQSWRHRAQNQALAEKILKMTMIQREHSLYQEVIDCFSSPNVKVLPQL